MPERLCTTCGKSLAAEPRECFCPVPDPPTLTRIVAFKATRDALLQYMGSTPHQDDPLVRAHVQAEIERILVADEVTIHRMAQELGVPPSYPERPPRRRKGTGLYPTAQAFLNDVRPILQQFWATRTHPSAEKVAALLPSPFRGKDHLSERHLRHLVEQLFHISWEGFVDWQKNSKMS